MTGSLVRPAQQLGAVPALAWALREPPLPLTLASCPIACQVRVYDLTQYEHCPDDVLVLGTDGLWDVTNDKEVAAVVMEVLTSYEPNDPCR